MVYFYFCAYFLHVATLVAVRYCLEEQRQSALVPGETVTGYLVKINSANLMT